MVCYVIIPDHYVPSWGVGILYHLVRLSNDLGVKTMAISPNGSSMTPTWLPTQVQPIGMEEIKNQISKGDLVIIPEVMVDSEEIASLRGRHIVCIQGSILIPLGLKQYEQYQDLGIDYAIVIMPHIKKILDRFYPIPNYLISPFVAPYFFVSENLLSLQRRKKQILITQKPGYKEAGYFDHEIITGILTRELRKINAANSDHWQVIVLEGMKHEEVADLMKESVFLLSCNLFESFNAIVPEAMAAGCIVFCYEAFGGQDFLRNNENAFVFNNNYLFPILERLLSMIVSFNDHKSVLHNIQMNAFSTAKMYTEEHTKKDLLKFYEDLKIC